MPFRIHQPIMHPISEIALLGFTTISVFASRVLLADASTPATQQFALQWFLLPFLGALASSVCSMMLNPKQEARKTVFARCIFGVVMGTAIPKIISIFHPALKELALDPAITFLTGFSVCMFAYIVSRKFVERMYGNADVMGEHLADQVGKKVSQVTVTTVETATQPTE